MRMEVEQAKRLFSQIPPDWHGIDNLLQRVAFSSEELAVMAVHVASDCFCEYRDTLADAAGAVAADALHSHYLVQSLRVLLSHGLDPNTVCDDCENVLWDIQYVDAPGVAAAAMRLLLENGGNPNHAFQEEPETLFEHVDFAVSYDAYTHDYLHVVQCLLLLMAYGGRLRNGTVPITMLGGHDVRIFKDVERFSYTIEQPQEQGVCNCRIMHIYDTETGMEAARYK